MLGCFFFYPLFLVFNSQAQLFTPHTVGICQELAGIDSLFQLFSIAQQLQRGGKSMLCMELWLGLCCSAHLNLAVSILSAFASL